MLRHDKARRLARLHAPDGLGEMALMPGRWQVLNAPLEGGSRAAWQAGLAQIGDACGEFQVLGPDHMSCLVDQKRSLLVSFEAEDSIRTRIGAAPLGITMARREGWSSLSLICRSMTWFRDQAVFDHVDQLVETGFFEDFDPIVFYGAGACGYAAAAFSVVAPGARVVALQPQATLDPDRAGWDTRFPQARALDFQGPYGFAPDMLDAAAQGFVFYNPRIAFDALHAAMFQRPHVSLLRTPQLGIELEPRLQELDLLIPILKEAAMDTLCPDRFDRLFRNARDKEPYLLGPQYRLITSEAS